MAGSTPGSFPGISAGPPTRLRTDGPSRAADSEHDETRHTPGYDATMTSLCDLSATKQSALIQRGELSARELLAASLARIEETNGQVNAIVTLDVEAAEQAANAADQAFAAGRLLGPLHGLTLGVKDLHATAGMRTTYGSPALADFVPDADELIVARMRAAGAVIVGKTNTPEFGAGSHTFNAVFGLTRNPYALDRSAGGSSGGSAAALACGMVSLADGSDMGGSLRNPASFCNVVGRPRTRGSHSPFRGQWGGRWPTPHCSCRFRLAPIRDRWCRCPNLDRSSLLRFPTGSTACGSRYRPTWAARSSSIPK
jgi:hypothetical protein